MADDDPEGKAKAKQMRELPQAERDAAIEASDNVLYARVRFEERRNQVNLSHAYRKPTGGGVA